MKHEVYCRAAGLQTHCSSAPRYTLRSAAPSSGLFYELHGVHQTRWINSTSHRDVATTHWLMKRKVDHFHTYFIFLPLFAHRCLCRLISMATTAGVPRFKRSCFSPVRRGFLSSERWRTFYTLGQAEKWMFVLNTDPNEFHFSPVWWFPPVCISIWNITSQHIC